MLRRHANDIVVDLKCANARTLGDRSVWQRVRNIAGGFCDTATYNGEEFCNSVIDHCQSLADLMAMLPDRTRGYVDGLGGGSMEPWHQLLAKSRQALNEWEASLEQ